MSNKDISIEIRKEALDLLERFSAVDSWEADIHWNTIKKCAIIAVQFAYQEQAKKLSDFTSDEYTDLVSYYAQLRTAIEEL
jgi:hypothetical protein